MPARKPRAGEKPQFDRFIETVREIGAGQTDEALDKAIRAIAPAKTPDKPTGKVPVPKSRERR